VSQQLDWAMLLASQPLPAGDRVLVVSNSGSQVAVLSDLVSAHGLQVAAPQIVWLPTVSGQEVVESLAEAAERDDWDMAVVAYGPFGVDRSTEVAAAGAGLAARTGGRLAAVGLGRAGLHPGRCTPGRDGAAARVPGYQVGVDAAGALAAARRHARGHDRGGPRVDPEGVRRREARAL